MKSIAGAVVTAALVFAPVVTVGASAAPSPVGVIGELVEWTPESNKAKYWQDMYASLGATCYDHGSSSSSHGEVTDGKKTVTLNEFDDSWPGDQWVLLVIKGGAEWNNVIENPEPGVAYASPVSNGGQQSDVSHWIVCKGDEPEEPQPDAPTQQLDCTTITVDYQRPLKNGDHINLQYGDKQVNLYVDRNIDGGWDTFGLRLPGGETLPLTEEQVTSGIITWNYAELLETDTFTVMFVQTNETDTWPKLECGPDEEPEPTVVVPSLTYTDPTCDAAGTVTASDNVTWSQAPGADGGTVWTASPKGDDVFAEDATINWPVPNLEQLPASHEDCRPAQPEPKVTSTEKLAFDCADSKVTITTTTVTTPYEWDGGAWVLGEPAEQETTQVRDMTAEEKMDCPLPDTTIEYGAWTDGDWECGDTTVEQTREVSTTVYEYAADGTPTAKSSVAVETQTRALTQDEIGECPLLPGDITSVCVGDVPYLGYDVTLPEGYVPTSENPVTITFVNPDGDDYVVSGQPLAGSLLWPGASAEDPMMWPGWELVDGEYAPTDGNFAWTREGITVRFAVNPTYETTVMYPEATALCANPPIGGPDGVDEIPGTDEPADTDEPTGTPASTDSEALAVTGGGAVSPIVVTAGAAAIAAGIALLVVMAYRRRRAEIG